MTRNVYTEPQSTTYLLLKAFWFPDHGGDVLAISVATSLALMLNTLYTLLTIYLFNSLWNVLLYAVMLTAPIKNSLAWNYVLSVYWNSTEPIAAWSNLAVVFQRMCWRSPRRFTLKDPSARLALLLTTLALITGLGSIAGGIFIVPTMALGNFAPVNPEAVWVRQIPELGALFSKAAMFDSPAAIRAIGSAEASRVTLRKNVNILQEVTNASTRERPDFTIKYQYNLTGVELGIRNSVGLVHNVRGRCQTEYGWLSHSNLSSKVDVYNPWGRPSNISYPMPSKNGSVLSQIGFVAAIYPDHIEELPGNTSFALLYKTGHLPSFSESSDAMYMTERMPENDPWSAMTPFRVQAERPVLSCWQDSTLCVRGKCGSVFDISKSMPPGLITVLARLHTPMVVSIANSLNAAALMSFFSPLPVSTVDAASSNTFADMERLVLGAYLLSRNILRDSTMTEPVAGFNNAVLDSKGQRLRGTGDFVLEVGSVTALSLPALITIPALTFFLLLLTMACNYLAHPREQTTTMIAQRERMINLLMPNLYRMATLEEGKGAAWDYVRRLHPVPIEAGSVSCVGCAMFRGRNSKRGKHSLKLQQLSRIRTSRRSSRRGDESLAPRHQSKKCKSA
ncbi:hypothetical protein BKA63DRAFT_143614 [Paraphoma chrysanthemicola]|nr:hypothetical protein BKA63DRAFT_143614 [Paraphoma chrysanthemicola]